MLDTLYTALLKSWLTAIIQCHKNWRLFPATAPATTCSVCTVHMSTVVWSVTRNCHFSYHNSQLCFNEQDTNKGPSLMRPMIQCFKNSQSSGYDYFWTWSLIFYFQNSKSCIHIHIFSNMFIYFIFVPVKQGYKLVIYHCDVKTNK